MPAKPPPTSSRSAQGSAKAGASPPAAKQASAPTPRNGAASSKAEHKILFQKYFKSIGPRTYAAQLKQANNGNHYLVLTEGKRDPATGEVRKTRVFVYSEDFGAYFRMLHETAQFIKTHPVPEELKLKRQRYWAKKEAEAIDNAAVTDDGGATWRPVNGLSGFRSAVAYMPGGHAIVAVGPTGTDMSRDDGRTWR